MKKNNLIIMAVFIFAASVQAGVGGSGGGPKADDVSKVVSVSVCDVEQPGQVCKTIRYKVRPSSEPMQPQCFVAHGEVELQVPCEDMKEPSGRVPRWLQYFNNKFLGADPAPPYEVP